MKRKLFILTMFFSLSLFVSEIKAQEKIVSGTVTSADDNSPLPGAAVVVKGTAHGTQTDFDGNYTIEVSDGAVLVFSYVGFASKEVKVNKSTINVALAVEASVLDEVVVTGYGGTRQRSKLTNSIASVKSEALSVGVHSNPAQALSGAVSGLRVSQTSGRPGAVPTITLRGGTNLDGSGSPLVIVDGQVRGGLNDINPNDIESIEVLKDAGATALYGARANNGVILVKTKSGAKSEISVKVRTGYNFMVPTHKFLNARDYLYWSRTAVNNSSWAPKATLNSASPYGTGNLHFWPLGGGVYDTDRIVSPNQYGQAVYSPMLTSNYTAEQIAILKGQGWQTMIDPVTGNEIIFSEFDKSEVAFNSVAITDEYNLSASGSNENGKYYAGLGYLKQEGMPAKTWYKRLNFTLNGQYKINDWLTSISNFSLAHAKWFNTSTTDESNYFGRMLASPPTQKKYTEDGEYVLGPNLTDGNPLVNIDKYLRDNESNKFNFGQTFSIDLAKGLNWKTSGHIMFDEGVYEHFDRDRLTRPGVWDRSRRSSASFDRVVRQTYNTILSYKTSLGQHNMDALVGYEFYDNYSRGFSAAGKGAPTDDFQDLGLTLTEENARSIDSYHNRYRIKSYFGSFNYDYAEKYLFSATFRRDGYSSLINNRWGFFPGVSAGWVLSKEDFISKMPYLSFLKLRSSFGLNGNASGIGSYELQGSMSSTKYNGNIGYLIGAIENPGLRWESSRTFEVGVESGFLNNKLMFSATYYNRLTDDKYAYISLPISSGISSFRTNNGSVRNVGVELEMSAKILDREHLKWQVGANISYNKNTIEKLPYNGLERNRQGAYQVYDPNTGDLIWVGGYQEGQSPGDLYVFQAEGIFQSEEQIAAIANNRTDITNGNNGSNGKILYGPEAWANASAAEKAKGFLIQPGDVIWKDVNNDGVIDNFDKVKVGNVIPKWFGGFNSTLRYENFTFYTRLDFALGFKQVDTRLPWFLGMMQGTYNTTEEVKNTWTPDNPNAKYPIYSWADQLGKRNYARESSMFVYDGSYLAFREVSLSYHVTSEIMKQIGVKSLDLSITGQNLGYLTASKLSTPEVGGYYDAGYPLSKTFLMGVDVKF